LSWPVVAVSAIAPVLLGLLPWWFDAPVLLAIAAVMLSIGDRSPTLTRLCGFALNFGMFGLIYAVQRAMGGDLLAWGAGALVGLAGFSLVVLVESFVRTPASAAPEPAPREWSEMAMDRVGPTGTIIELAAIDWRHATGGLADPAGGSVRFEDGDGGRYLFDDGTRVERAMDTYAFDPDGRWFLARMRGGVIVCDRVHRRLHRLRGWQACGWHEQPWFDRRDSDLPVSLHDVLGQR
jgi:hypothetical protein